MSAELQVHLQIATPKGLALEVDANSVQAPSIFGEFGVMGGHVPLLATLKPGVVTYRAGGTVHRAAIGSGFAEAGPNKIVILTDEFLSSEDVDVAEAEKDLKQAESELKSFTGRLEGPDYQSLQRRLDWARARLGTRTAHNS